MRAALVARPDLLADARRTLVVAAGKAAVGMAGAAAAAAPFPPGLVLAPRGADSRDLPSNWTLFHGGHPEPDAGGFEASRRILAAVRALGRGERLLFLLSGGASALLEVPAEGLCDDDLVAAHRGLVASGLPIASINLVRGCLSAVKAGGLARAAAPARVTTMAVSDVEGDHPHVIGSGPTAWPGSGPGMGPKDGPTSGGEATLLRPADFRSALAAVASVGVALPEPVLRHLERGAALAGAAAEGDPSAARDGKSAASAGIRATAPEAAVGTDGDPADDYTIVASVALAAEAARRELARRGYAVESPGPYLGGPTLAAAGRVLADVASWPRGPRRAAVYGGETTVALPASGRGGRGGRNLDLAARLALGLAGRSLVAVSAGTDGIDGSSRAAGALVDGASAARAEAGGLPLAAALAAFDTEPALDAAGDLLVTGPTGTNVGDLLVVVSP